ncbi:MAG: aminotransferase class I/II-fold pyridoxal phosphate-dependent enzyme [Parvularcula sp.]|nr:aminotransferase class I/II-fold pyridoxal phosphate-dependent enzyme [Parvularcula sp.]
MSKISLAERLHIDLPRSVFAQIGALKAAALAEGREVIDLGIGNPGIPPDPSIVERLTLELSTTGSHRYAADNGSWELKKAQADYYRERFGVDLDPQTEIVATSGAHEAFLQIAKLIGRPGGRFLVPSPAYPVHETGFRLAGAETVPLPASPAKAYLEAAEAVLAKGDDSIVGMVMSYPHNPSTATADASFYAGALRLAETYDLLLISDLAYAELYFDGEPPPSLLQTEGAIGRSIELTSLSKTFSVPGWRVGLCSGNAEICGALKTLKSHLDYGIFPAVQRASAAALRDHHSLTEKIRAQYRERRDGLLQAMRSGGAEGLVCDATMFAWLALPRREDGASMAFTKALLAAEDVVVSPGSGFGPYGEGYVRIALVEDADVMAESGRRIARFLQSF